MPPSPILSTVVSATASSENGSPASAAGAGASGAAGVSGSSGGGAASATSKDERYEDLGFCRRHRFRGYCRTGISCGRWNQRCVRGRAFEADYGQRRATVLESGRVHQPRDSRPIPLRASRGLPSMEKERGRADGRLTAVRRLSSRRQNGSATFGRHSTLRPRCNVVRRRWGAAVLAVACHPSDRLVFPRANHSSVRRVTSKQVPPPCRGRQCTPPY